MKFTKNLYHKGNEGQIMNIFSFVSCMSACPRPLGVMFRFFNGDFNA